jgi:hypothetical protein
MFGIERGLEFGAVMTATCLSAALATERRALARVNYVFVRGRMG